MKKDNELNVETSALLAEQARWIVERYEGINSGLLTRSAQMIGFLGVEFGFILNKLEYLSSPDLRVGLGILLVSLLAFVLSAFPKSVNMPDIQTLYVTLDKTEQSRLRIPIEQLFSPSIKDTNYLNCLRTENKDRARAFNIGILLLVLGQGFVFLPIVIGVCV